jgi:hypothetical protein
MIFLKKPVQYIEIVGRYSLIEWKYASPWRCCIELSHVQRLNVKHLANPPFWASKPFSGDFVSLQAYSALGQTALLS